MPKLFERHPLPWSVENLSPQWDGEGGFIIFDANKEIVIHGGTMTGDGDIEVNLTFLQADELVKLVNSRKTLLDYSEKKW